MAWFGADAADPFVRPFSQAPGGRAYEKGHEAGPVGDLLGAGVSVPVAVQRCGRTGSYGRDGLMARFGADIALPDLLVALASCERRRDFSNSYPARRPMRRDILIRKSFARGE